MERGFSISRVLRRDRPQQEPEPAVKGPDLLEFAPPEEILAMLGEGWTYKLEETHSTYKRHTFIRERPGGEDNSFISMRVDTETNRLSLRLGRGRGRESMYAPNVQHIKLVEERKYFEEKRGEYTAHYDPYPARIYFNLGDGPVWINQMTMIDPSRVSELGISYYPSTSEAAWDMGHEKGYISIQL